MTSDADATPATEDRCPRFRMNEPEFTQDPYPTYARLREDCPVAHADEYFPEYGPGGYWIVTRHEDVVRGLRDPGTFSSADHAVLSIPAMMERDYPVLPQQADPPLHTRYRALVSPVFRRSRVDGLFPGLLASAGEILDGIIGREDVDLVKEFAETFSLRTLADFMDLPREDTGQWRDWVEEMLHGHSDRAAGSHGSQAMTTYVDDLIAERQRQPVDDFISMLLASEVDGQQLRPEEIRGFLVLVLIAGHDTTTSSMSATFEYLARHPEQLDELRRRPELIPTAVEEFLRYTAPIQTFARVVTQDTRIRDVDIARGEVVAFSYGSANRDPEAFDRPDEVLLDREPNRHLTFGTGPHLCVGAHVARLEMRVLLQHLVERVERVEAARGTSPQWKERGDKHMLKSFRARLVALGS